MEPNGLLSELDGAAMPTLKGAEGEIGKLSKANFNLKVRNDVRGPQCAAVARCVLSA